MDFNGLSKCEGELAKALEMSQGSAFLTPRRYGWDVTPSSDASGTGVVVARHGATSEAPQNISWRPNAFEWTKTVQTIKLRYKRLRDGDSFFPKAWRDVLLAHEHGHATSFASSTVDLLRTFRRSIGPAASTHGMVSLLKTICMPLSFGVVIFASDSSVLHLWKSVVRIFLLL